MTEMKFVADLRVYTTEDRCTMTSILAKNGYNVSQIRMPIDGKKGYEYGIRVRKDPDAIQTTK